MKNSTKYIITLWTAEFDYDGVSNNFAILAEYDVLKIAQDYIATEQERMISNALLNKKDWGFMDVTESKIRPPFADPNQSNKIVYSFPFKIGDGSGYNSMYFYFDVIELPSELSVDRSLFNPERCAADIDIFFRRKTTEEKAETLVKGCIQGMRKGTTNIPNWTHSFRVRDALRTHEFSNDVVLAGLLHDTIEDGNISIDNLRGVGFSDHVVVLVDLCSHDPTVVGGEARWIKMVARLVDAKNQDAWAIKIADITDNLRSCHTMPEDRQRFMRQVKGELMLRLTKPLLGSHALWEELNVEVNQ